MQIIKLNQINHKTKIGQPCPYVKPNIDFDCLLELDGNVIGFYIHSIKKYSPKLSKLIAIANAEFRSKNVPKSEMNRGTEKQAKEQGRIRVAQYSTVLGSRAPKPHMRMPYPSISIVHQNKKAKTFIKAMLGACIEAEKIIKDLTPHIHEKQTELFKNVPEQWKFGNLFTSSISNYNISAPFHRDNANIVDAVNIIITKRHNSKGGCLHVPDYNATFDQADDSMLVYPAWKNIHGVTPIIPTTEGGYRNSLVFYPLKAFLNI